MYFVFELISLIKTIKMIFDTKIEKIMSTDLETVDANTTLDEVERLFRRNKFHHLPVMNEDKKIIGIISKSDLLLMYDNLTFFQTARMEEKNRLFFQTILVEEVMTKHVVVLYENDPVTKAADYFRENLFHAIPIVNSREQLVGIVTTFDLINFAYK